MEIHYTMFEPAVLSDAPFIGSRISGYKCSNNCKGCCNQQLLYAPVYTKSEIQIIHDIKSHGLSDGIILGGLEWSEQPEELLALVKEALRQDLKVIIYTHHTLPDFLQMFKELWFQPIYIKCGAYEKDLPGYLDEQADVRLASNNQKIYRLDKI